MQRDPARSYDGWPLIASDEIVGANTHIVRDSIQLPTPSSRSLSLAPWLVWDLYAINLQT